tara:strand:+ start:54 stop:1085 length:1032 start_codon:yes stop_codon:yes gene_type:complete
MKRITLLDLFSGIGGFHLGLQRAGFKIKSYNSEIDKNAKEVYKHNFKYSTYVGSVTDVRGSQLPRIDAITFGSPCQDFSLAGNRKGMEGERSSLILEAIRLIQECRPRFFIWENVKGTFSSNAGEDFAAILQAFANLGGYRLEWQLLNTKWFLPQNRERVYLVGYTPGQSRGQIFPIGESIKRYVDEKESSACITTSYHKGVNFDNQLIAAQRGRSYRGQPQRLEINSEGVSNTLSSVQKDNYVLGYSRDSKGKVVSRNKKYLANTVYSSTGAGGNTDQFLNSIRRLTPIECERLQGFPDNWTLANGISDTQRYKLCGNAVTVDVVGAVGKRILETVYGKAPA